MKQGYVRRTIHKMLERISDGKPSNQSHICNVSKIWTKTKNYQLKRLAKNKVGASSSKSSRKFSLHRSTISRQLKNLELTTIYARKHRFMTKFKKQKQKN